MRTLRCTELQVAFYVLSFGSYALCISDIAWLLALDNCLLLLSFAQTISEFKICADLPDVDLSTVGVTQFSGSEGITKTVEVHDACFVRQM